MTAENQIHPPEGSRAAEALRECEEARRHAQADHWGDAVTAATRAIEADPDCLEAYQLRSSMRTSECDWSAVIADCTEMIRLSPKHGEAYTNRAFAYVLTGQFERAILDCDRAIDLDALDPRLYETRAHALHKLGRETEAAADLRRSVLLRSTPEETAARDCRERLRSLLHRGDQFLRARQIEEAIQAFSAVLLECPQPCPSPLSARAGLRPGWPYSRSQSGSGRSVEAEART